MIKNDHGYIYSPKGKALLSNSLGVRRNYDPSTPPQLEIIKADYRYSDAVYALGRVVLPKVQKVTVLVFDQYGVSGVDTRLSSVLKKELEEYTRELARVRLVNMSYSVFKRVKGSKPRPDKML